MDNHAQRVYEYLGENLKHLGKIKPIGSAVTMRNGLFYRDIDVKLYTECTSKEYVKSELIKIVRDIPLALFVPLHVFVVGNFLFEVVQDKMLIIHYTSPITIRLLWLKIHLKRFFRSLLPKSKKI